MPLRPPLSAPGPLLTAFGAYESAVLGLADGTVSNHAIYLAAFLRWWDRARPGTSVLSADPADVAAFLIAEGARGLAARTRRAEVAALRRFYGWLVLTGQATRNPVADLPLPRAAPPQPGTYTANEVAQILAHTSGLTGVRGRQRAVWH